MGQEAVPACAAMSTATTITTPMERTPNPHGWAASVEDTAGAATWTTNGIAAAAPRHPPLPLALRLDQLAKLLMISGQAMMWLGHVQKAEVRRRQARDAHRPAPVLVLSPQLALCGCGPK